jgi:hypothetical protein
MSYEVLICDHGSEIKKKHFFARISLHHTELMEFHTLDLRNRFATRANRVLVPNGVVRNTQLNSSSLGCSAREKLLNEAQSALLPDLFLIALS